MKRLLIILFAFVLATGCAPGAYPAPVQPAPAQPVESTVIEAAPVVAPVKALNQAKLAWTEQILKAPIKLDPKLFCQSPFSTTSEVDDCYLPSLEKPANVTSDSPVVILVVDDFGSPATWVARRAVETDFAQLPGNTQIFDKPPAETDNCLMQPDGQGHYIASGTSESAIPVPHGELVYAEVERLLAERGYVPYTESTSDQCWKRHIEFFKGNNGYIVLAGVDTQNYTTQVVADNIDAAIAEFGGYDIVVNNESLPPSNRFIINMSFAVVPCKAYDTVSLEDVSIEKLRDSFATVEKQIYDPALTTIVKNLDAGLADLSIQPYPAPSADESGGYPAPVSSLAAPSVLEGYSLPLLRDQGLLTPVDLLAVQPNFVNFYLPTLKPDASREEVESYINDLMKNFPDSDVLVRNLRCYAKTNLRQIISVASAGNFNSFPFPFVPALLDEVVSVSADYSGMPAECGEGGSNAGEVRLPGWYQADGDCMVGTSFAAPMLSTLLAVWMLEGYPYCAGNQEIIPQPLGYADLYGAFSNLTPDEIFKIYCQQ